MKASLPHDEAERLEALHQYGILDTPPEEQFDDLTHLAAQVCGAPISVITLLDKDRQWFKSCVGLEISETSRVDSFCAHAILQPELLVVPDATQDERFADNPFVTGEPGLRFYAGIPLVTANGHALGTLCVLDTAVRQLNKTQQDSLCRLGRQVVALLEARRDLAERLTAEKAEREGQRFLQSTIDALSSHLAVLDERGEIIAVNKAWRQFAKDNNGSPAACGVGANYLEVCDRAKGNWCEEAPRVARGIREVMAGDQQVFCTEYPCHSADETRWFNMCATRFAGSGPVRVVVSHENITPRKSAEDELRDSRAQFKNMVENVPGVVYQILMKADGSVEWPFVGRGFEELFERTPDILKNDATWPMEQIHPDDREDYERCVAASGKSRLPSAWEGRIQLTSGVTKWIHITSRPQPEQDGTLWNGIILDVTERRAANEERYRFFTMSLDLLCIVDSNGYLTRLNPAFESTLGYSRDEMMSRPFWEFVHPDDRAATLAARQEVHDGRSLIRITNRYRHQDGSYRWLSWVSVPYEGMVYAVAHDITPLKQAEAALHKVNTELESRVRERTTALADVNAKLLRNEARLLAGNQIATELFRLSVAAPEELEATLRHITEASCNVLDVERSSIWLLNEDDSALECRDLYERTTQRHSCGMERKSADFLDYFKALQRGRTIVADDAQTHPDTRDFWQSYLQPLGIASVLDTTIVVDGKVVGVLCQERIGEPRSWDAEDQTLASMKASICALCMETHQRAQAEIEMRQAKEEAETANLAKSEFLSRMSHELRTPLNAILGFGQILDNKDITDQQQECVGHILKGGRHLLDMINEVLDIARVEAGQLNLSLEPIAVAEIVREACALMHPLANGRNLRLIEHTSHFDHHYALADRVRLKQVLLNLLGNAIKFNLEGRQVEVVCGQNPDGLITIAVRDTGPGISPENMAKIFMPFERLGAAEREIEGTGLGLTVSQRLMTAMNGTLELQSTPGQGTTATIGLSPAEEPQMLLAHTSAQQLKLSTPPTEGAWKLLCIEDNPSNLRLVEVILEARPDITLLTAVQGSVGLDLARSHEPDLILLDLNVPDMHGKEVMERLQQSALTRDIPVVIVSADASPNQIQRLLAAGAKDYLTKPLDVDQFLRVLDTYLQVPPTTAALGDDDKEIS